MAKILILFALIGLIATLLIRWWFGLRILRNCARHSCLCNLSLWGEKFGSESVPSSKKESAVFFAQLLRQQTWMDWKKEEPKKYASRKALQNFGKVAAPLSLMIVAMGVFVGRIPAIWILPIFFLTLCFSALSSYLGIVPELQAVLKTSQRLRQAKCFHRKEEEDAVIAACTALAWKEAAPPIFQLIQK